MSEVRKVKQFAVYVQAHYTVVNGAQTSFVYPSGVTMMDTSTTGAPNTHIMSGTIDTHWKLHVEKDSLDEALAGVRELLGLGHPLNRIKLDQRVHLDENFQLVM
jgi:hypothetical protein